MINYKGEPDHRPRYHQPIIRHGYNRFEITFATENPERRPLGRTTIQLIYNALKIYKEITLDDFYEQVRAIEKKSPERLDLLVKEAHNALQPLTL